MKGLNLILIFALLLGTNSCFVDNDGKLVSSREKRKELEQGINDVQKKLEQTEKELKRVKRTIVDAKRDSVYRSLHYLILAGTHHPDVKTREAMQKVEKIYANYGLRVIGKNWQEQSKDIIALTNEFEKNKDSINTTITIDLKDILNQLNTAQGNFQTQYEAN
ncbi:MAG: hypothetical protein GY827_12950 [Cytophagales bacterium]|nr:hypothetical protein [Cytophagales bacterium]